MILRVLSHAAALAGWEAGAIMIRQREAIKAAAVIIREETEGREAAERALVLMSNECARMRAVVLAAQAWKTQGARSKWCTAPSVKLWDAVKDYEGGK